MHGDPHRHGPVPDLGLPEVVDFALGAGAMATAMTALASGLSGSEAARRVARQGVRAELLRVTADLVPTPRDPEDAARPGRESARRRSTRAGAMIVLRPDGNLGSCRGRQGES
ncbi:hypothetical protein [Blastococcus sp. CT_GayMR16]|uniref:hypothetical protein n=1 Tax=Blastococcus sp. CT_GayMR16 TaxID=2559607 RepID=UPI0010744F5E|nr:hypothetical protein [Blastococcus sp. CT_GayMR16]TFV89880.1 hypothetical protein E4P38_05345 [Blastococcus sp. CT_GayMR16]